MICILNSPYTGERQTELRWLLYLFGIQRLGVRRRLLKCRTLIPLASAV